MTSVFRRFRRDPCRIVKRETARERRNLGIPCPIWSIQIKLLLLKKKKQLLPTSPPSFGLLHSFPARKGLEGVLKARLRTQPGCTKSVVRYGTVVKTRVSPKTARPNRSLEPRTQNLAVYGLVVTRVNPILWVNYKIFHQPAISHIKHLGRIRSQVAITHDP